MSNNLSLNKSKHQEFTMVGTHFMIMKELSLHKDDDIIIINDHREKDMQLGYKYLARLPFGKG